MKNRFLPLIVFIATLILSFIIMASSSKHDEPRKIDTSSIGKGNLEERVIALENAMMELSALCEENSDYIFAYLLEEGKLRQGADDSMYATAYALLRGLEQLKMTLQEPTPTSTQAMQGELPEKSRIDGVKVTRTPAK